MVEFRKCFSNFKISMTLFYNLAANNRFLLLKSSTLDLTLVERISCKIYTQEKGARNISSKKWEIYFFKIKIIPYYLESQMKLCHSLWTIPSPTTALQYQKNSPSKVISLKFRGIYLTYQLLKIGIINIK